MTYGVKNVKHFPDLLSVLFKYVKTKRVQKCFYTQIVEKKLTIAVMGYCLH